MFTLRCLTTDFLYLRDFSRRRPHRKQRFPSIVACIRGYKAVAWQHVYQIRYSILISRFFGSFFELVMMLLEQF
jgi:hypothetical protein